MTDDVPYSSHDAAAYVADQVHDFADVDVDAALVHVEHFRHLNLPDLTVVSPDAGGVERARFFAKRLDAPLAIEYDENHRNLPIKT